MKKLTLALLTIGVLSVYSCKDESKETPAGPQTATTSTTTAADNNITVNPAHGQPGHRCDIPVGADLTQAAGTPTPEGASTITPGVSPVRVNSDAKPLKNPPHGQPGHNCAVPVGADL